MTAGQLPPEQVIEWLRSGEGEQWSRNRIWARRYAGQELPFTDRGLTTWHDRDVVYVPGLFSLREQAGYGDQWDWEVLAARGQHLDLAYSADWWQGVHWSWTLNWRGWRSGRARAAWGRLDANGGQSAGNRRQG